MYAHLLMDSCINSTARCAGGRSSKAKSQFAVCRPLRGSGRRRAAGDCDGRGGRGRRAREAAVGHGQSPPRHHQPQCGVVFVAASCFKPTRRLTRSGLFVYHDAACTTFMAPRRHANGCMPFIESVVTCSSSGASRRAPWITALAPQITRTVRPDLMFPPSPRRSSRSTTASAASGTRRRWHGTGSPARPRDGGRRPRSGCSWAAGWRSGGRASVAT